MQTSWDLRKLRNFIEDKYGNETLHIRTLNSLYNAIDICQYHLHEAKENIDLIDPSNDREAIELVFPREEDEGLLWKTKLAIQANTQAAVHCSRSVHELFAQLVNVLVLDSQFSEEKCTLNVVVNSLPESPLKEIIQNLKDSTQFKYISAFDNMTKHRTLVKFGTNVSLVGEKSGVYFKAFKYNDLDFGQAWAEDVLKFANHVKNMVISCGAVLNDTIELNT